MSHIVKQMKWLDDRASKIDSQNLESLSRSKIFAFGEITHGSKECLELKNQAIKTLILNHGYKIIALEAPLGSTGLLNEFVLNGQVDPAVAIAETGFWSIANETNLDLVKWVRSYNLEHEEKVHFFGYDVQSMESPLKELRQILKQLDGTDRLPSDRQLFEAFEKVFKGVTEAKSNSEISTLKQEHVKFMKEAFNCTKDFIQEAQPLVDQIQNNTERFLAQRCLIAFDQVLDNFSPNIFEEGARSRDRSMAKNIQAFGEFFSNKKIILSSHNWHISKRAWPVDGAKAVETMGSILKNHFKGNYIALGFAFHHGEFLSLTQYNPEEEILAMSPTPREDVFEYYLGKFAKEKQVSQFFLDLSQPENFPWTSEIKMNLGEAGVTQDYDQVFVPQPPHLMYDGLFFFQETSPTKVLKEYYHFVQTVYG